MASFRYNLIGKFLKQKRVRVGLSQRDLALKLGYGSAQFISNIERGEASVPPKMARKLVTILNLSERELVRVLVQEYEKYLHSQISRRG